VGEGCWQKSQKRNGERADLAHELPRIFGGAECSRGVSQPLVPRPVPLDP
jgi:hypothetical protein